MKAMTAWFEGLRSAEQQLWEGFLDSGVTDDEYAARYARYVAFFHSSMEATYLCFSERDPSVYEDPSAYEGYFQPRTLFYAARNTNPTMGKELSDHVSHKELYEVALNAMRTSQMPVLTFAERLALTDVGGVLKVVYGELFMVGKWERIHGWEPAWVTDFGKREELLKVTAPEHPESLALYNELKA